jgi:hypothetical protein
MMMLRGTEQNEGSVRIPDNAVGTLSQLFGHRVPLVNNKVLVEDLEDLAAL